MKNNIFISRQNYEQDEQAKMGILLTKAKKPYQSFKQVG